MAASLAGLVMVFAQLDDPPRLRRAASVCGHRQSRLSRAAQSHYRNGRSRPLVPETVQVGAKARPSRITEMAVLVRWATVHWDELKEPLGFTRDKPPCATTISRALAGLTIEQLRWAFAQWLKTALPSQQGRWAAAGDGKTCAQGLAADGSPVQMLNVFLQRVKLTLDQWSISGDKTNEPGSLKQHLAELLAAYPALSLLTGDAIYAQRPLLELLQSHGVDYLFQVKSNQPDLLDALKTCFARVSPGRPHHESSVKKGLERKRAGDGSISTMPSISGSV